MSRKGANSRYWRAIREAWSSSLIGLMLTWKHFKRVLTKARRTPINVQDTFYFRQDNGLETLSYPHEKLPIPDNGRYKLHNEIDDCIVCDKCAKICPVDCIEIESIKSSEIFGYTSDGTSKRIYAAKFNIDMAKCCFCGLCTTVCPTECLTMTKEYDFSEFDVRKMNIPFAVMTEEEANEKKLAYETAQKAKAEAQLKQKQSVPVSPLPTAEPTTTEDSKPKPVFKPKVKPTTKADEPPAEVAATLTVSADLSIVTKSPETPDTNATHQIEAAQETKKPIFRPKVKTVITAKEEQNNAPDNFQASVASAVDSPPTDDPPAEKPIFRPKIKPIVKKSNDENLPAE